MMQDGLDGLPVVTDAMLRAGTLRMRELFNDGAAPDAAALLVMVFRAMRFYEGKKLSHEEVENLKLEKVHFD